MIIYICLSLLAIIISAFVFHPHLLLFPASAIPFVLFVLTIIEIYLFKKESIKSKDDERLENTAYILKENDISALKSCMKYLVMIKSLSLPLFIIFVFFFIPSKKIICSVLLYVSTYICARVMAEIERRTKNKK